jgi:hypothetical protein
VGLGQGPLSLVSITEELLEWKSSGSGGFRKWCVVPDIGGGNLWRECSGYSNHWMWIETCP